MVKKILLILIIFSACYSKLNAQVDFSKFKGELVSVSLPTRLERPFFQEYRDTAKYIYPNQYNFINTIVEYTIYLSYVNGASAYNQEGTPRGKQLILSKAINNDSTGQNFIVLQHKLTFLYQSNEVSIIKFYEVKDSITQPFQTCQFIKTNSGWRIFYDAELEQIAQVIGKLKTSMFWEFNNKGDGTIIFINDDKKKMKNEEGILNVSLLAGYLNDLKRMSPEKYNTLCDN